MCPGVSFESGRIPGEWTLRRVVAVVVVAVVAALSRDTVECVLRATVDRTDAAEDLTGSPPALPTLRCKGEARTECVLAASSSAFAPGFL